MRKIFIPIPLEEIITIPEDTAHHMLNVFRHPIDEPILVGGADGRNGIYQLTSIDTKHCIAKLIELKEETHNDIEIVLVQSFLKGDKFELVLQKATELNVHTIYGTSTEHSIAKYDSKKLKGKEERWLKICQEASQQCGRATLPYLEVHQSFKDIIEVERNKEDTLILIAYEREDKATLKDVLQENINSLNASKSQLKRVVLCIGPEGGWHPNEANMVTSKGGEIISLGTTILRAETASIAGIAMLNYSLSM